MPKVLTVDDGMGFDDAACTVLEGGRVLSDLATAGEEELDLTGCRFRGVRPVTGVLLSV